MHIIVLWNIQAIKDFCLNLQKFYIIIREPGKCNSYLYEFTKVFFVAHHLII